MIGGLAAMVLGPTWGRLLDAWGAARASAVSVVALILVTVPLGLLTSVVAVAIVWMAAAALVGFVVVNIQNLSAIAVPANRGGALSTVMSFRFVGHAIGPLIWVPVFSSNPELAFAGAASLGVVTLVTLVAASARTTPPPKF